MNKYGIKRLTEKSYKNLDPWECCGQDKHCTRGCHEKGGCANGCVVPKLYRKLAEFEDAEQDGRLVILPCNDKFSGWIVGITSRKTEDI